MILLLMSLISIGLVLRQIFLKFSIKKYSNFGLNFSTLFESARNIYIFLTFITFILGLLLWIYVLNNYEFNRVYPLLSLNYIYGLAAAKYIFRENIPKNRFFGVLIIIIGVVIVTIK